MTVSESASLVVETVGFLQKLMKDPFSENEYLWDYFEVSEESLTEKDFFCLLFNYNCNTDIAFHQEEIRTSKVHDTKALEAKEEPSDANLL